MFQDYSPPDQNAGNPARISSLRDVMKKHAVTGFIVPRADEHQGEYVPARAERLAWLTGFTGSAGLAVILEKQAAIFIDGRYTLQVRDQVATDIVEPIGISEQTSIAWLEATLQPDDCLGHDPWLTTMSDAKRLGKAAQKAGATLKTVPNLVDEIWLDQPSAPLGAISVQPTAYAGETTANKLEAVRSALRTQDADAFILTQPDSICWLLNIRGADVPHNPVTLGFALVQTEGPVQLFTHAAKITDEVRQALATNVTFHEPHHMLDAFAKLAGKIGLEPATTPQMIADTLSTDRASIVEMADPCVLPKARKNKTELAGARAAHVRDGRAMVRFLTWLDRTPISELNEISAAQHLEECRVQAGDEDQMPLKDISFDTISGFGPNGAIVHYRVTEATNLPFTNDALYLVDSGGQYQDGTTDITRTISIGTPSHDMRRHYTLVLKGMIAISRLRFPKGTNGAQLDAFARVSLWQVGLDFDHGTGHGVGAFLSVHEGPQRISKVSNVALEPGMILSNEPGYYKTDAYGIRIENLIVVTELQDIEGGDRPMMGFETITCAPLDPRLIDTSLLNDDEIAWLNTYHAHVYETLNSTLDAGSKDWLKRVTQPL